MFDSTDFALLRAKSIALTGYLEALLRKDLAGQVDILTPADSESRGCQLSLRLRTNDARRIFDELNRDGFICDWRAPDIIRIAPVPLYNSFLDAWEFADALRQRLRP